jgi:endonuclease/exonuclease/phosphatase family metal-dependent hydrolase
MPILRVATYNLRHGLGLDGKVDLGRTAAVLRGTGAGIVALQELDDGLARSGRVDQAADLARRLGVPVEFQETIERGDGRYGIGLAGAVTGVRSRELPRDQGEEPRRALWGRWSGLTVVCTHLSLEEGAREAQTKALADLVRELEGPLLLMGDLNQTRRRLGPLFAAGLATHSGPRLTHGARRPHHQIDWILGTRGARVRKAWTLRSAASDHRPLIAELEV